MALFCPEREAVSCLPGDGRETLLLVMVKTRTPAARNNEPKATERQSNSEFQRLAPEAASPKMRLSILGKTEAAGVTVS